MKQDRTAYPDDETAQPGDSAAGYNHHVSRNARAVAKSNPVADALGKVLSLLPRRDASASSRPGRPPREADVEAPVSRGAARRTASEARAAYAGEDYLGTGSPCRVCGRPVEPTMSRCPHCGSLRVALYQQAPFWIAVAVALVLVVLLSVGINSCASKSASPKPSEPASEQPAQTDGSPVAQDKSALTAALAQGQAGIDENAANGTYTVATVMALQKAMEAGQAVASDEAATETQVTEAVQAISDAVASLRNCPTSIYDYSALDYATISNSAQTGFASNTYVSGTVLSVSAGTDGTTLTVALDGDEASPVLVTYNALSSVDGAPVEGGTVECSGTVSGVGTWGDNASVPTLIADYVVAG